MIATPKEFPGFWIFMYRVNPFQYVTKGLLATTLAGAPVHCADNEFLRFDAPPGVSCGEYMAPYLAGHNGYLSNTGAGEQCLYCPSDTADDFLAKIDASYGERWMNFGLIWVFIAFNVAASFALYYAVRVPKNKSKKEESKVEKSKDGGSKRG